MTYASDYTNAKCRLCDVPVKEEELSSNDNSVISPCRCSGESKYVHRKCLDEWINLHENVNEGIDCYVRCSVCRHHFFRERRLKPLHRWIPELSYNQKVMWIYRFLYLAIVLTDFYATPRMLSIAARPWHSIVWLVYWDNVFARLLMAAFDVQDHVEAESMLYYFSSRAVRSLDNQMTDRVIVSI